jgi:hypothetical protein
VDGQQAYLRITPDGTGGAIIVWEDWRADGDIYSQRVNAGGVPLWTENGVAVCTASALQSSPEIASDGSGGAITVWYDYRNVETGLHLYAQRIGAGGGVTGVADPLSPLTGPMLEQNVPNPFNPTTGLRFDLPSAGPVRLAIYDLAGRLVRVLVEGEIPAGSHEAVWDGRDASGRSAPSGSYLARLVAGGKVEGVRLSLVR